MSTETGAKRIGLVKIPDETTQNIGPAAGLLAAHRYYADATWLVVACDFPLLHPAALHQIRDSYEAPVTCFVNTSGFSEPLLAIWSPHALRCLQANVESGRSGPSFTVKQLVSKLIAPTKVDWILDTNTKEEWEVARLRDCGSGNPQSIDKV